MTVFPRLCVYRVRAVLLTSLVGLLLGGGSVARASGPTERVQQVFPHPTDPNRLTVRFGMATSGYLYSTDGGKTFRAMCSTAVDPTAQGGTRIKKISLRSIASTAANAMDSAGRTMFSQYGSFYSDDGTGCSWDRVAAFDDRWAFGIQADPTAEGVVWAAVTASSTDATPVTTLEIARRDAEGAWTTVGPIVPPVTGEVLLDGNMLATTHEGKTRLYVTANLGGLNGYLQHVYVSDDEGETWEDFQLPPAQESLALLAVDPQDADRLVGVIWRDGSADELFLSEDRGKTFAPYPGARAEIRAVSGATFDARGRFLVGDQGDGIGVVASGGLYVAERLGAPLQRAEGTEFVDCVHYRALTDTLYVCSYDKLSTVDPETFEARELVRFETVAGLLECPGRDLISECKDQLNEGPAWCCTGHFPFTSFCGEYDVTRLPDGRRVFCGLSGREYERPGSTTGGSQSQGDAGTPLASLDGAPEGAPAAKPRTSSSGGCALGDVSGAGAASGLISMLTVTLASLARRRGKRRSD